MIYVTLILALKLLGRPAILNTMGGRPMMARTIKMDDGTTRQILVPEPRK